MSNDTFASFLDRLNHGFLVPGQDGSQVDNLDGDSDFLCHLSSHSSVSHLEAVSNQGNVAPFLQHLGFAKRDLVVFERNIFLSDSVECLWLKEEARVVATDAG